MTATRPVPTVRRVDPRCDPAWRELASGPCGSLFTAPPWIAAVSESFDLVPEASVAIDASGRPRAGVAWVDIRDLRGGRRVALPFSDRADPLLDDDRLWPLVAAAPLAGDLPFSLRCLQTSAAATDPALSTVGAAAWHLTPLDRDLEVLRRALRPATRRNIASAARAGVQVVLRADRGAIDEYHRLHLELRRNKYRLLAQPREFFRGIWSRFAPLDGIRTGLALVDGQPVAGAVYLIWRDTVYYKFGASRAEYLPVRPNDALHWAVIEWAHARGLSALDWGRSDLDQPGLIAYKRGWASTEGRIVHRATGGHPVERTAQVDALLATVTDLLTDPAVPDSVLERAGQALYRFFG
ncbi:lipid II:glycine glycyltransferase FemX [Blastococcus sp. SYSU D00695]